MFFASAVTQEPLLRDALHRLETRLRDQITDQPVDLALLFLSSHFRRMAPEVCEGVRAMFAPRHLLGCAAEGVIGSHAEIEQRPAITLMLARLPGVRFYPFMLQQGHWDTLLQDDVAFRRIVAAPDDTRLFLLFCDPFTTPVQRILSTFDELYPGVPVLGGMASAAMAVGQNMLISDEFTTPVGAVGLGLAGDFDLDVIVSQGCRPIGEPYVVTQARGNVIIALENQPPMLRIQEVVDSLSETERGLLQRGLLIGRAINPMQEQLGRGDFLIRGVLATDRHSGTLTIGDTIEPGEIVQFHVRDAETAREDLEMMLIPQAFRPRPDGALLFTCNGRGTRLYEYENGDVSVIARGLGNVPMSGFFCAGEIGPVSKHNFVHGHTACLAIFRPGQPAAE
jgi:small ligand-binding sensory domain FIST